MASSGEKSVKKGFTLVEVIVALVIVLLTAAGIFASFITAKRYVLRSNHRIVALNFARQKTEDLRRLLGQNRWNQDLPAGLNPADWSSYESLPGEFGARWLAKRRYKIEPVEDPPGVPREYRRVTVEISWNEATL